VYSVMKFERGVHRVQRVPVTETTGRVHTSTSSVAILAKPSEVRGGEGRVRVVAYGLCMCRLTWLWFLRK